MAHFSALIGGAAEKTSDPLHDDPVRIENSVLHFKIGMDECTSNPDDYIHMSPEELAESMGVCRAFVRIVLDAGCPLEEGLLTREMLFRWLHGNSDLVRKLAGLPDVPTVSDCTISKAGEWQEARAILTMLDFMRSRACTQETRDLCAEIAEHLAGPSR